MNALKSALIRQTAVDIVDLYENDANTDYISVMDVINNNLGFLFGAIEELRTIDARDAE